MNMATNQSVAATIPDFKPSAYKISTITATGCVNTHINLDAFYEHIIINDDNDTSATSEGFMYIEFGKKKSDTFHKGYNKKMTITRRKQKENKRFDNQATVIMRLKGRTNDDSYNLVNMKIFKNGNVQMTGLKYIDQGKYAIEYVINELRRVAQNCDNSVVFDIERMHLSNYRIRLINSDFRVGFDIKRDKLYKLIQGDHSIYSSFEPCIYPGVKIQYNYNTEYERSTGVCDCESECNGKGSGSGDGNCKKITIAVFQSGCIIITGAQSHDQIDAAYDFICNVICDNLEELYKKPLAPVTTETKEKKKILIKKSNIQQLRIPQVQLSIA